MKKLVFILGNIIDLTTLCSIAYILIWWGIVIPIFNLIIAIDAGTMTFSLVLMQLIHFLLRGFLATIVGLIGWYLADICYTLAHKSRLL